MKLLLCLLFSSLFALSPSDALDRLLEGNRHYMDDELVHPNVSSLRREEIVARQTPFATIVGCSDSRVPPEIIFDQGLGDLFSVRVAGNVAGPIELDSIEYSVKILKSSLIVVMGHEGCGAVKAVMQGQTADIEDVANLIKPAIKGAKNLEEAVKDNVLSIVRSLRSSPLLRRLIADKKIDCIGAYYHLGSGNVELLK